MIALLMLAEAAALPMPAFLSGCWEQKREGDGWTEECWTDTRGGLMIGSGRDGSGDKVGLPDFMRALHAQFGKPGRTYALADLERIARQLTGHDFSGFFAEAVGSESYFDIRPSYAALGLRMDSFVEEMFISREPQATPAQRARFEAIFEAGGEEVGDGFGEARVAAFGLGVDGIKVHEPRLEQRLRHRLQRLVYPPVQVDLVVQRAEDVGDRALFR